MIDILRKKYEGHSPPNSLDYGHGTCSDGSSMYTLYRTTIDPDNPDTRSSRDSEGAVNKTKRKPTYFNRADANGDVG